MKAGSRGVKSKSGLAPCWCTKIVCTVVCSGVMVCRGARVRRCCSSKPIIAVAVVTVLLVVATVLSGCSSSSSSVASDSSSSDSNSSTDDCIVHVYGDCYCCNHKRVLPTYIPHLKFVIDLRPEHVYNSYIMNVLTSISALSSIRKISGLAAASTAARAFS
eukprot:16826-Heterococcus_DN1.PRE.1